MAPGVLQDHSSHSSGVPSPVAMSNGDSFSHADDEPLAIVGMAFRLPQDATTEDGLWDILVNKRNVMTEFPKDRVNVDAFYHPDTSRPGNVNFRGGHFLNELPSAFDAPFFSITAAEAEAMDPQQRLALETTFHALEDAGMPLEQVSGSVTSVHTGCFSDDYRRLELREPEQYPSYACSGVAQSMLSNRVSWFFNLQGASMSVDTACSSSMTALDIACQGLRNKNADAGIVIGSNLMLGLELSLTLSNMNFLSPDSKCYSFDHRANGYGRGEGVGVLVIKRLSTALKAGDTIRAIIRATGSNQDGRTPGITQPSASSQEHLIRTTYARANLDMSLTTYVEAHGTGTAVGDPIEASAIGNAFRQSPKRASPVYIGSVKSNLGHLEGCSGLAGVFKTILMLERGILAPNANFEQLNPGIDDDHLNIRVVSEPIPWPTTGLRRASVSSFGFGGANSHVILDDAYNYLREHGLQGNHCTSPVPGGPPYLGSLAPRAICDARNGSEFDAAVRSKRLLVLSAGDQDGIARVATALGELASGLSLQLSSSEQERYLDDLVYTMYNRRSLLNWRSFAVVDSLSDIAKLGDKFASPKKRLNTAKLAYAFTGQGAQYAGMAEALLKFPVFVESLRKSETFFNRLGCSWSTFDELAKPAKTTRINEPDLSQPLCSALQIGIVDLLRYLGVAPSVVVGHSSGEIAAAYAAGALSHESACKLAYYRGFCMKELAQSQQDSSSTHGMMAVGLSSEKFQPYLDRLKSQFGTVEVVVACLNSPTNITVSGAAHQLDWLKELLDDNSTFARRLRVNVAYHSPQMRTVADIYLNLIGHLGADDRGFAPTKMISSVIGRAVSPEILRTAQYWVDNMVLPVKFSDALTLAHTTKGSGLKKLKASKNAAFNDVLEIGPHSALQAPIQDTLRQAGAADVGYLSVLNRFSPSEDAVLQAVGNLFGRGHKISAGNINFDPMNVKTSRVSLPGLPKYPFDHSRHYWTESRASREGYRLRKFARHDLLGVPSPNWSALEPRWTCLFRVSELPWTADHKVRGSILYPAAGMVAMALEAVKQIVPEGREVTGYTVNDTIFARPIAIPANQDHKEVEIVLRPSQVTQRKHSTTWDFKIFALEGDKDWQEKCNGTVSAHFKYTVDPVDNGREARARQARDETRLNDMDTSCNTSVDTQRFYAGLADKGFVYGPSFQVVSNIRSNNGEQACADIDVYNWQPLDKKDVPQEHLLHPITLDGIFQMCFAAGSRGHLADVPGLLPSRLNHLWIRSEGIHQPNVPTTSICMRTQPSRHTYSTEAFAIDPVSRETLMSVGFECRSIDMDDGAMDDGSKDKSLCFEWDWQPNIDMMDSQTLTAYCETARNDVAIDPDFYENIDYLATKYLLEAIESVSESRLAEMSAPLQRYMTWAYQCRQDFENGLLRFCKPSDAVWQSVSTDSKSREALRQRMMQSEMGSFFATVAHHLPEVLSGEKDAVQFMFEDDRVGQFYNAINRHVFFWEPLARFMDLFTHKNPSLKILEVGAGTGGSTYHILQMLAGPDGTSKYAQYDYTDISPAFFDKAAETYAEHAAKMAFRVFDVEKDPAEQGFETGTYDVIFAANVLHATEDLEGALRNARKLLKPGGKLIMFEIVEQTVRMSLAFGLFPGWWLGGKDRYLHPWLRVNEWHERMQRTGFSGVDIEMPDFQDESRHELSLIITTAVEDQSPVTTNTSVSVLLSGENDEESSLAEILKCTLGKLGQDCELISWKDITESQVSESRHWISLYELAQPLLSELDADGFATLKRLLTSAQSMLWVTGGGGDGERDPRLHVIDGLARTLCTEKPGQLFTTLALDPATADPISAASKVSTIFTKSLQKDSNPEPEFIEQNGYLCTNRVAISQHQEQQVTSRQRLIQEKQQPFGAGPPLALAIGSPGLLDTIHFIEDTEHALPLAPGTAEVKIDTGGVNFRDCLTALGQLEADYIGIEYAGVVSQIPESSPSPFKIGDRVTGWCHGSYQTYTRNTVDLMVPIPDELSFTDAAASMTVFTTAWHSLVNVGRLAKGERVLIQSAAGGTGQAAIQIAKYLGAEVYVTVGSVEKKRFLQATYGIPEERIFASRDLTFADGVMRATDGKGVDVILNSLSGESLLASWNCLAACGRFVEIGNRDIIARAQLPMWPFIKGCSFTHVALYVMVIEQPRILKEIGTIILKLLADKTFFVPQPLKVFNIGQVQEVFRLFQTGDNYGRMVVQMRDDAIVDTKLLPSVTYTFDPARTYVIAGGLGGLGRSIARWMAKRGARNLILLSRSGPRTQEAQDLIKQLTTDDVKVQAPPCDVSDLSALQRVVAECADKLPPIAGCIQASMVLRDTFFENMSFDDWNAACGPKIKGTWNLHSALPRGLDFFTCLSSISCITGNTGQANYAAGNSYMDELVRYRILRGEKAMTINLGWVEKEGVVAETTSLRQAFEKVESLSPVSMEELYALLDYACDPTRPLQSHQVINGLASPKKYNHDPETLGIHAPWLQKPSFRPLLHAVMDSNRKIDADKDSGGLDYPSLFRNAAGPEAAVQVVGQFMRTRLSKALAIKEEEIDMSVPLHVIGVDSLFGIELRNHLAKQFQSDIAVFDLMGAMSVEAACELVANRSKLREKESAPA